jgi:hypothetical protein
VVAPQTVAEGIRQAGFNPRHAFSHPTDSEMARKKHGFLLFDLPSDHEVDGGLSTECDVIKSILHNRAMGGRVKIIRATTKGTLDSLPRYHSKVQFVHLACHGGLCA